MANLGYVCIASFFLMVGLFNGLNGSSLDDHDDLLVVTIATEETDGFRRFMRSAQKYGLDVKVFGLGKEWIGGDIEQNPGGGQKIILLKEGFREYKGRADLKVMFVDSYDLVFTNGAKEILERFDKLNGRVVFSAEGFCWPDESLACNGIGCNIVMEKEGFIRSMKKLEELGLAVHTLITDWHPQIQKYARVNLPTVNHFYDAWHVAKEYVDELMAMLFDQVLDDDRVHALWEAIVPANMCSQYERPNNIDVITQQSS